LVADEVLVSGTSGCTESKGCDEKRRVINQKLNGWVAALMMMMVMGVSPMVIVMALSLSSTKAVMRGGL